MSTKKSRLIVGIIGNILEWYDFAIFGYLAVTIGVLFFPSDNPTTSLLQSFSVFAIGYLARPLGGILFGQLGDKYGRSKALRLSMYLMGAATFCMGMLPTYSQIGIAATVLLVLLRVAQGISAGGEFVGSAVYMYESSPQKRQTFWCSFATWSSTAGVLLGSLVITLLHYLFTQDQIENGGWRIPYLCGAILAIFGIFVRRYLLETEVFENILSKQKLIKYPLLEAFKYSRKAMLQVLALNVFVSVSFYTLFVWMPTFLQMFLSIPLEKALFLNTLMMVLLIMLMPLCGLLADYIGRERVAFLSALSIALIAYPVFMLISTGSIWAIGLALILFAVCFSLIEGTTAAITTSLFPADHRYSGIGISYNISMSIFGGTTPLVCTYLISTSGFITAPGIYVGITAVVGLIAIMSLGGITKITFNKRFMESRADNISDSLCIKNTSTE